MEFRTELKQILDIIIHSLYTHNEIFLRELISNAADAIDKVRFESLTNPGILEGNSAWKIKLIPNREQGTLTVSDNGIGMSRETIVDNLGTIARSGTRQFLENLRKADARNRPELIGQFGVGFYSAFMVADRVAVLSRAAGDKSEGVKWESDGQGAFTIEPIQKEHRGTDVILHLRDDAKEFLDEWRLREIVKKYSDFIEHPIVIDVEREKEGTRTVEEETLNSRKAIWLRPKSEVKEEEYKEFYKQISRDFEEPLTTIHFAAEGTMEFRALLYLPKRKPFDFYWREPKAGLQLYVRRVLIMQECEQLLPTYLRFVKGVVDSSDLPLNVSRETLQHNPLLPRIKSNVVNRIFKTLEEMKTSEYEKYLGFYDEFGVVLKEGVTQDWANKDRIADLLLFESTKTEPGKYTTLAKHVEAMPAEQKEIYYLIGESREMLENSPYLESCKAAGQEVLLLTDNIDEFVMHHLGSYKDKKLKAVDRATADDRKEDEQAAMQFRPLLEALKRRLAEVKDVRLSSRLKESAAVLVADEHGPSAHFERLMERVGRKDEVGATKRILELNPQHPAVQSLKKLHETRPDDPKVETFARLLHDQAVIAEGSKIKDPASFARRINELMTAVTH
jgi:molecular chaperone HtpG